MTDNRDKYFPFDFESSMAYRIPGKVLLEGIEHNSISDDHIREISNKAHEIITRYLLTPDAPDTRESVALAVMSMAIVQIVLHKREIAQLPGSGEVDSEIAFALEAVGLLAQQDNHFGRLVYLVGLASKLHDEPGSPVSLLQLESTFGMTLKTRGGDPSKPLTPLW